MGSNLCHSYLLRRFFPFIVVTGHRYRRASLGIFATRANSTLKGFFLILGSNYEPLDG